MAQHIFLSYAPTDRKWLPHARAAMSRLGIGDQEAAVLEHANVVSAPGEDRRATLREAIESSDQFVVLWSPAAAASEYVNYEIGMAEALAKHTVVVLLEPGAPKLPDALAGAQIIRLSAPPTTESGPRHLDSVEEGPVPGPPLDATIEAVPKYLAALVRTGSVRNYRDGTLLLQEGQKSDVLYVVLTGRVRLFVASDTGREFVLESCLPGDFVGELTLDADVQPASAVTVGSTRCAVVSREDLLLHFTHDQELALAVFARVARRARSAIASAKNLALIDVYGRVARLLTDLSVERAGHRVVDERLTMQDIANRVGGSREMVSRILRDLSVGGFIEARRGSITLKRPLPHDW